MATDLRQRTTEQRTRRTRRETGVAARRESRSRSAWARFLHRAVAIEAVLVLAVAAWLTDPEAAAIGAGLLVGSTLLVAGRSPRVARVVVLALSANVLGWMALGLATNLATRQGTVAVMVPAALTAASAVAIVAGAATFRRAGNGPTPVPTALTVVAVAVLVVATAAGSAMHDDTAVTADVEIQAADVRFSTDALEADTGELTVAFENRDLFWHTFTIDALGVDVAAPVGATRTATFTAEPGTYDFRCRIPGHESLMSGTLTVR